jgi:hypothetical protein
MPLRKYHPLNYKNKSNTVKKVTLITLAALSQPHYAREKLDIKKKL